jgi:RNA polymerase sigma-70 factor (ECF subfamily)
MEKSRLLARAKRFEPDALREIHAWLYEPVYRYIYFSVENQSICEDLTSEVFLRILEQFKRDRGWTTTPKAWALGIARNTVADHYRKKYRRMEIVKIEPNPESISENGYSNPFAAVDQNLDLQQAILTLKEDYQDVILLRFMEGLQIKEVAELLGKTPTAVKALQRRALAELAGKMEPLVTKLGE